MAVLFFPKSSFFIPSLKKKTHTKKPIKSSEKRVCTMLNCSFEKCGRESHLMCGRVWFTIDESIDQSARGQNDIRIHGIIQPRYEKLSSFMVHLHIFLFNFSQTTDMYDRNQINHVAFNLALEWQPGSSASDQSK